MKMNTKRNLLLAAALFLGAAFVFVSFVVYPVFRGVVHDHERALEQRREFVQLGEDREHLAEFERLFMREQSAFDQLERVFLDLRSPIEFFRFLDRSAEEFGITLEKTPGLPQTTPEEPWTYVDVHLEGEGTYPGALAFIEKIESSPYLLELKGLNFSKAEGQLLVRFSINTRIYAKD